MPSFSSRQVLVKHVFPLVLSLMALIKILDMVPLIKKSFLCLSMFNVDPRTIYDGVYNLLAFGGKLLTTESALEKLLSLPPPNFKPS